MQKRVVFNEGTTTTTTGSHQRHLHPHVAGRLYWAAFEAVQIQFQIVFEAMGKEEEKEFTEFTSKIKRWCVLNFRHIQCEEFRQHAMIHLQKEQLDFTSYT